MTAAIRPDSPEGVPHLVVDEDAVHLHRHVERPHVAEQRWNGVCRAFVYRRQQLVREIHPRPGARAQRQLIHGQRAPPPRLPVLIHELATIAAGGIVGPRRIPHPGADEFTSLFRDRLTRAKVGRRLLGGSAGRSGAEEHQQDGEGSRAARHSISPAGSRQSRRRTAPCHWPV